MVCISAVHYNHTPGICYVNCVHSMHSSDAVPNRIECVGQEQAADSCTKDDVREAREVDPRYLKLNVHRRLAVHIESVVVVCRVLQLH
eukprot:TRINITY_DN9712_c0_g1_i1.p1 TRINITY_DN9712_c0_g1~~TRINITY_DN9712_c0_g1_i1.p1  ORF type:complete len:88 (+),score=2.42 TRINITY_DN9712_c0_g1_i1:16-279(+)